MRRFALTLALVATACGPRGTPPPTPSERVPRAEEPCRVTARDGARLLLIEPDCVAAEARVPVVTVDVAATHAARERGLGGQESLPDGRGMLFVYPDSRARSFWMKDCLVALDIAFLDADGRIRDIATLPPGAGLTGPDIPLHECASPTRYVLEVRARWYAETGVAVGDLVDLQHVVRGVVAE